MRLIAGFLVLAMLPGLLVFRQTGVSREALEDENRGIRLAAQQLLESDPYARGSRIRRMSDFARNLLRKKRSYEDYELAVQIAIAQARYDEALAFQEKALSVFTGSEEDMAAQYLRMAYLYVLVGEYDKALSWLDLGIAVTPYVEAVLTRAQVRLNTGDTAGALEDVDACLKAAGESTVLLPDIVNIYEAAGAYEKAIELWTRVLDSSASTDGLLDRAYCYVQLDRMTEAEADIARYLLRHEENRTTANTMLAMGWLRRNDYAKADEFFTRALSGDGTDPGTLYYYIVLCAHLRAEHARACEYGEQLIARIEGGESVSTAELRLEDATGRLRVELVPLDYAQLCRMVGASWLVLGDYERSSEVLSLSLRERDDPTVRYLRGSSLLAAERYEEALEDYTAALAANVRTESSRYGSGVCRMQLGLLAEAIEDFRWVAENGEDASLREEAARQLARLTAGEEETETQ